MYREVLKTDTSWSLTPREELRLGEALADGEAHLRRFLDGLGEYELCQYGHAVHQAVGDRIVMALPPALQQGPEPRRVPVDMLDAAITHITSPDTSSPNRAEAG